MKFDFQLCASTEMLEKRTFFVVVVALNYINSEFISYSSLSISLIFRFLFSFFNLLFRYSNFFFFVSNIRFFFLTYLKFRKIIEKEKVSFFSEQVSHRLASIF